MGTQPHEQSMGDGDELPWRVLRSRPQIPRRTSTERTNPGTRTKMTRTAMDSPVQPDWLPQVRPSNSFGVKVLRRSNVEAHRHRDWFLALAWLLETREKASRKSNTHSKMFTKFYLFLRDFIPQGLTGRFAHLHGHDVMCFLSCNNESTVSRHKVTKYAEIAWTDLERWMGESKSWGNALERARRERDQCKGKKSLTEKAPGLHSPEAMLAVLVISYPDPDARFKRWITRLQIDWMMTQPRDELHVRHGFWKGLTSENLAMVFAANEGEASRKGRLDNTLDAALSYDQIFGPRFLRCRRDIRPEIPAALQLDPLEEVPSDVEEQVEGEDDDELSEVTTSTRAHGTSAGSNAIDDGGTVHVNVGGIQYDRLPEITPAVTNRLGELLESTSQAEQPGRALERWLLDHLRHDTDGILSAWCAHWEGRIEDVDNFQDQMITRSLFHRSLRLFKALTSFCKPLADGFLMSDLDDRLGSYDESEVRQARSALSSLDRFKACTNANELLRGLIRSGSPAPSLTIQDMLSRICAWQAVALCRFNRSSEFFKSWANRFTFEALCTNVVVQRLQRRLVDHATSPPWPQVKKEKLFDEATRRTLQLQVGQLQGLFVPGDEAEVLTDWQYTVFHQKFWSENVAPNPVDFAEIKPQPTVENSEFANELKGEHGRLCKLFGTVNKPPVDQASVRSPRVAPDPEVATVQNPVVYSRSGSASIGRPGSTSSLDAPIPPSQPLLSRNHSLHQATPQPLSTASASLATPQIRGPGSDGAAETNIFAGMSHSVAPKRGGSPMASGRALKTPRLGGLVTRDDLVAEVQQLKEGLEILRKDLAAHDLVHQVQQVRAQLNLDIASLRKDLLSRSEEAGKIAAAAVEKPLGELNQQHTNDMNEIRQIISENKDQQQLRHDVLVKEIAVVGTHARTLETTLERQKVDIMATITNQHQVTLDKLDIRGIVQEILDAQDYSRLVTALDVQGTVQAALREQSRLEEEKAPPMPGQDGYLAQCVAPAHWPSTQKAYEEMLFRAASLYINTLDDNDHGCWEDGDAMEVVSYKYPGLCQDHMKMALHHAHVHHFGRLFGQAHNPRPGSGWPINVA